MSSPVRADSAELAEAAADQVAVYVHIPFCRRICPYCDFAVTPEMGFADRYVAAVRREIGKLRSERGIVAIGQPICEPGDLGIGHVCEHGGQRFLAVIDRR